MSTTHNLSPIELSPSTPEWARAVLTNMQVARDKEYLAALDAYYGRCQVWIDDNVFKRSGSPNPSTYSPTQFTEKVPQREENNWGVTPDGSVGFIYRLTQDPNVHPPVLPPYVAPAANTGFQTGAPAQDAGNQAALATIITMLMKLSASVEAIRANLKI